VFIETHAEVFPEICAVDTQPKEEHRHGHNPISQHRESTVSKVVMAICIALPPEVPRTSPSGTTGRLFPASVHPKNAGEQPCFP